MSVDPGEWYERWHKSDHCMVAFNTIDAVRAAEFWLYFPNQKLQQGLQPYKVQVSQLEPAINRYRSDWDAADKLKAK